MKDTKAFTQAKDLGDKGEKAFMLFAQAVTGETSLNFGKPGEIEGWDNGRLVLSEDGTSKQVLIEVKTIKNFLGRNNDGGEQTGTLPFEMWQTKYCTFYGWLYAMIHPEEYNRLQMERRDNAPAGKRNKFKPAVTPEYFVFCLSDQADNIFSFISFKFDELVDRLEKIETRWTLKEWNLPMVKDQNYDGIVYNVWQVPFQRVQDLARVTMLNYRNMVPDPQNNRELQTARLNNLVNLANGEKGGGCIDSEYNLNIDGSYIDLKTVEKYRNGQWITYNGSPAFVVFEEATSGDTGKI